MLERGYGKIQASEVQTRARSWRTQVFVLKQFCNLELGFSVDTSHVILEREKNFRSKQFHI